MASLGCDFPSNVTQWEKTEEEGIRDGRCRSFAVEIIMFFFFFSKLGCISRRIHVWYIFISLRQVRRAPPAGTQMTLVIVWFEKVFFWMVLPPKQRTNRFLPIEHVYFSSHLNFSALNLKLTMGSQDQIFDSKWSKIPEVWKSKPQQLAVLLVTFFGNVTLSKVFRFSTVGDDFWPD